MIDLYNLVIKPKKNDEYAAIEIINRFKPLMVKHSWRSGYFDEDCYQECVISLIKSIELFKFID